MRPIDPSKDSFSSVFRIKKRSSSKKVKKPLNHTIDNRPPSKLNLDINPEQKREEPSSDSTLSKSPVSFQPPEVRRKLDFSKIKIKVIEPSPKKGKEEEKGPFERLISFKEGGEPVL